MFVNILAAVVASVMSSGSSVEIKLFDSEAEVAKTTVAVNSEVRVSGSGGTWISGNVNEGFDQEIEYTLTIGNGSGLTREVDLRAPLETCTQRNLMLDREYVLRICGVPASDAGEGQSRGGI